MENICKKEDYLSKEYLVNQPYVFTKDRRYIVLKFIEKSFEINNISKMKDEEIKNLLVDTYKYELIKNLNGKELYNKISEEYLGIKEEPKKIYEKYLNNINMHLKEIEKNIKHLESLLLECANGNGKDLNLRKIKYYISKNIKEKDNIKCIKKNKLKKLSLMEAIQPEYNRFGIYRYAEYPKGFYIENDYSIRIKFYSETMELYEELKLKYKNNKKEYYRYMNSYIDNNHNLIENMILIVENNYYLKNRKSILCKTLYNFKNGNKEVFVYLAGIQIEGIFFDYCKIIGLNFKKNSRLSLTQKIEEINHKIKLYGYEYFKFDFPKIRNKIAHGRVINNDINNLANELFLDLNYILNLFNEKYLNFNAIKDIIEKFKIEKTEKWLCASYIIESIKNKFYCEFLFGNKYNEVLKYYDLMYKRDKLIYNLDNIMIWDMVFNRIFLDGKYDERMYNDFKNFKEYLDKKGLFPVHLQKIFEEFEKRKELYKYGFVTKVENKDEEWTSSWWRVWEV